MSPPDLQVSSAGTRKFVAVATDRAAALHAYLRAHRVRCDPPDPSISGVDVIELHRGCNVDAVQALLDRWA
jgi:hypothetical protein